MCVCGVVFVFVCVCVVWCLCVGGVWCVCGCVCACVVWCLCVCLPMPVVLSAYLLGKEEKEEICAYLSYLY